MTVGHDEISYDEIERFIGEHLHRLFTASRLPCIVALLCEEETETLPTQRLIINDQDFLRHRKAPSIHP